MKKALMALAVLCVAMIAGCKKGPEQVTTPPLRQVIVTISMDPATNKPKADPDSAPVKPNDEVVWQTSPPNQDFEVKFKTETPFQNGRFDRGSNKSGKSRITVPPGQERKFFYNVTFQGKSIDPDVIIKPGDN